MRELVICKASHIESRCRAKNIDIPVARTEDRLPIVLSHMYLDVWSTPYLDSNSNVTLLNRDILPRPGQWQITHCAHAKSSNSEDWGFSCKMLHVVIPRTRRTFAERDHQNGCLKKAQDNHADPKKDGEYDVYSPGKYKVDDHFVPGWVSTAFSPKSSVISLQASFSTPFLGCYSLLLQGESFICKWTWFECPCVTPCGV